MLTDASYQQRHLTITGEREATFLERVDSVRLHARLSLDKDQRGELGQYFTPSSVARSMASMISPGKRSVRLLDAGAGAGVLTAAFVAEACQWDEKPDLISVLAFELDTDLTSYLEQTLKLCRTECGKHGVGFSFEIRNEDFILSAAKNLSGGRYDVLEDGLQFDVAILNPPYGKMNTDSEASNLLRRQGIFVPNAYAAFLALSAELLASGGELVAITPRSFCNGTYFKPFRRHFTSLMSFRRFHVFESRDRNFDEILQENIVFCAVKNKSEGAEVVISTSMDGSEIAEDFIRLKSDELILPGDEEMFIHLGADELDREIVERMKHFQSSLDELGLAVSTGKVVDFRVKDFLGRGLDHNSAAPLIYPHNIQNGDVAYPVSHAKKFDSIRITPETESSLVDSGTYVLVKRFSSKEEKRRVTAAVFRQEHAPEEKIGFENHLNYFHARGKGIEPQLARGLALYLNSSLVDAHFRQFSGHTQVNATDLRYLKYPSKKDLEKLGDYFKEALPPQDEIDLLINRTLLKMTDTNFDPARAKARIEQALSVLKQLGFPAAQQNERSALSLLALLGLKPGDDWSEASSPMIGITQMMKYFADAYGKHYMPNTRESVRRQTIHQFLDAGLIVINPDKPDRAINSGSTVYQITPAALELLRTFSTEDWVSELEKYLAEVGTLREKYAQARKLTRLPVTLPDGQKISLSPGGQNVLIMEIVENFCPYFTPGGKFLYIGDADEKWAVFDDGKLTELGVTFDSHGKMPDVVVYYEERGWLVLIEAVTSHGPVNPKRREELKSLFAEAKAGLVFVTAFPDRRTMTRYLGEIAWETEVWTADAPTHLIHFNGERFLGPYE